jgi:hypothetical protein
MHILYMHDLRHIFIALSTFSILLFKRVNQILSSLWTALVNYVQPPPACWVVAVEAPARAQPCTLFPNDFLFGLVKP